MTPTRITGLVAATFTPFSPEGALALAVVPQQAEHLLAHGITTVFIGGTTGECHSLSLAERQALAARWFEVARGTALQIVVHVGANCLADVRTLASQAARLGARAVAAMAPSYFKPGTVSALVDWCAAVAGAAPETPFYFYDIPALTGVALPMPEFLAQAQDRIPNLAGLKFTNPDLLAYQLCLHAADGRFDILYGIDEWLLAALALGGQGAVGSSYNFAAPIFQRLVQAFSRGDLATAQAEQFRAARLAHLLAGYGYLGAAKATLQMLGVQVGPVRPPLRNLSPEQRAALRGHLEQLGFFDWVGSGSKPAGHAS